MYNAKDSVAYVAFIQLVSPNVFNLLNSVATKLKTINQKLKVAMVS